MMYKSKYIFAVIFSIIYCGTNVSAIQTTPSDILAPAPTVGIPDPAKFVDSTEPAGQSFLVQKMQPFIPNTYNELPFCDEVSDALHSEPVTMSQFLNTTGQPVRMMVDPVQDFIELPGFLLRKNSTAINRNNTAIPSSADSVSTDTGAAVITALVSLLYLI